MTAVTEAIGVLVERIDPVERSQEAARFEAVADSLARLVGRSRRQTDLPVAG